MAVPQRPTPVERRCDYDIDYDAPLRDIEPYYYTVGMA